MDTRKFFEGIGIIALVALLAMMALLSCAEVAAQGSIIYVDGDAAGAATGLSWTDAYTNVQDALSVTNANGSTDYEIWVAEGVYYPDEGAGRAEDAVTETFRIDYNNVQLYGGFVGIEPGFPGETLRSQRDWKANLTVLSGDLQQDDADPDGDGVIITTTHIITPNVYHVLWLDGVTSETITETTVIDGFTITAGWADGGYPHSYGGGLYCEGSGSGNACSPALTHVTFSGNQAGYYGGGLYNRGANGGHSSPALTNVTFRGNQAGNDGGGMYNDGDSGTSSPELTNGIFIGNRAEWDGGGLYNDGSNSGTSSPALTNVTFSGNRANYGGAMYNWGSGGNSSPALTNVIIWGNTASAVGEQLYNNEATPVLSYSLIQSGTNDIYNTGATTITYGDGILTRDPHFVAPAPTSAGNYRLQVGSPAIDMGDNSAVVGISSDLDGNPRLIGGLVDLGAYESALRLRKSVAPTQDVAYHGAVTYTVTLGNAGAYTDTVLLTDTLPPSTTFASWVVSPTGTLRAGNAITWSEALTAGHTLTWTFTATHTGDHLDVITNTAHVSGTLQTGSAADTFAVQAPPDLSLAKTVTPTRDVAYRGAVTYTLALSNTGAGHDTCVLLTDTLPPSTTFASWVVSPTGTLRAGNAITWSGALNAGRILTWTFVATHTGNPLETVTNTAYVSGTLQGTSDAATFTVGANAPPVADAGGDQSTLINTTVMLDGSGSHDPDGHTPLTYGWQQTGGPAVTLSDASGATPTFTAPDNESVLTFTLTVTDAYGSTSAPDEAIIHVRAPAEHTVTWETTGDFAAGTFTDTQPITDSVRLTRTAGGDYIATGEYRSQVYDAGDLVDWHSLIYTATVPPSTTLTLYTRVGNTPTPDAHWSSWFTHTMTTTILPQPPARYAQFELAMTTAVTDATPILDAVTLGWDDFAYTAVEGSLDNDATWDAANAPYLLPENVVVRRGVTLTIEPGVTVWFSDSRKLLVEGTLIAQGMPADAITFTTWHVRKSPGDWGNITFNGSVGATFDTNDNYLGGSVVRYATIEYAGYQVDGALQTSSATPFIDHCTLRQNDTAGVYSEHSYGIRVTHNTITSCAGHAVYSFVGDGVIINHNTLSDNDGTGIYNHYGYGLDVSHNTLAGHDAGIHNSAGNAATISHNVIADSRSSGLINDGDAVTITHNILRDNNGNGIRSEGADAYIHGNHVQGTGGWVGSGILSQGDDVILSDNVITGTRVFTTGGGLRSAGANVRISGNVISGTQAGDDGGGIWSTGDAVEILDNVVTHAVATNDGGGLYHNGSSARIADNVIVGSFATSGDGGGLWHWGTDTSISGNIFHANQADDGGGLYHSGDGVTLSANTVTSNTASSDGGGMDVSGDDATIQANAITSNTAAYDGGGLQVVGASAMIKDNTITHNSLTSGVAEGGGLYHNGDGATIRDNTVSHNEASGGFGGGVWSQSSAGTVTLDSNTIVSNTTGGTGGGLYSTGDDVWVTQNVITGNVAGDYGGLRWEARTGAIAYNIVTTNTAGSTGGMYVNATGYTGDYPIIHHNNLRGNRGYALYNDSAYSAWGHLDARHNFWGTTEAGVIDDLIYDFLDDADKSIVDFIPALDGDAPDLRASSKSVDSAEVAPGTTVQYTLLLSNTAPSVARAVHLTDTLPSSVTYVTGTLSGGATYSATDRTVRWQGALGPYQTQTIEFQAAVPPTLPIGTQVANTAALWGDGLTETLHMTAIFTTASVPLQDTTIEGPTNGAIRTPYHFVAEAIPAVATPPFTYTWSVEPGGGPPIVHTGGLSDTVTLTWFSAGQKTLHLTVENPVNAITRTHQITIEQPGVTIDGPTLGVADIVYTFTACTGQMVPAAPITYTWEIDTQPPITTTDDALTHTWATGGVHTLTVRADNGVVSVTDTHTVELYDDTQYTHLDGQTISGERRWTATQSPYLLTGNVLVNEGARLTIEPGVMVLFSGTHKIEVQGTLIAQGTADQMIHFTDATAHQAPGAWQHIKFGDLSVDAIFDANGTYTGGSILQYVLLEYAGAEGVEGAIETDNAAPFVDHVTLRNNGVWGISNQGSAAMRITNNTLQENAGGISNAGANAYIMDNTLFDNTGVGIRNSGFSTLIQRNTLQENAGGGIHNDADGVTLSENTLTENATLGYGGGIYNAGSAVTISYNTLTGNAATYDGGGIWSLGGSIMLTHNTITSNTARLGGGIYNNGNDVLLSDNTLTDNASTNDGGGLWSRGDDLLARDNIISRNTGADGGGLHIDGADATFRDNVLRDNRASGHGGGAWSAGRAAFYEGNTLHANVATGSGGGLWRASDGPLTLRANTVTSNTADGQGGGVYALSDDGWYSQSVITVTRNVITGNVASEHGGLTWGADGGTIERNVIVSNTGRAGDHVGGIYLDRGYPTIHHNNLSDNAGLALYNNNAYLNSEQVDAQFNWWGTITETAIADLIFDFSDDAAKSAVDYQNWLTDGDPDLRESAKHVTPASAPPGGVITYTLTLTNPTPSVARPVYLSDTLPISTTYLPERSSAELTYHSDRRTLTWQDQLGPYEEQRLYIVAHVSATAQIGARITNTAFLWEPLSLLSNGKDTEITGTRRLSATFIVSSIPVQQAAITGPTRGRLYTSDTFTATVGPELVARPIVYTWRVLETAQTVTHTGDISDTAVFTWTSCGPGPKTVQLVAANANGRLTRTHVITVHTPPLALTLDGPTIGLVDRGYTFEAQVTPITATAPLTYTWQVDDDPPRVSQRPTQAFTWTTPGPRTLTVSAANAVGHVTATHAFTIAEYTSVKEGENIVVDTLWTAAASPYLIEGNVLVNKNTRLTLEPGTVVLFDDQSRFEVQGTLIADGTAARPITFTAEAARAQAGAWQNLYFEDASQDATFDTEGNYVDGSILRHVFVEYAGGRGASGAVQTDQAVPFVDQCTIRHNGARGIHNAGGDGMRITHNTITDNADGGVYNSGDDVLLSDNAITGNATASWGGGIHNRGANVTLRDNTIAENAGYQGGGLYNSSYGYGAVIEENALHGNHATSHGGGLYNSASSVQIEHNQILSNTSGARGGGLYNSGGYATLRYNTIKANTSQSGAGIYNTSGSVTISGNTLAHNVASGLCGGIYHDGDAWRAGQLTQASSNSSASVGAIAYNTIVSNTGPTAGGLYIATGYPLIQYNSVYSNSAFALYNNNPYAGDIHLEVRHNWWGTTDRDIIKQSIYDWREDEDKSIVDYEPWLASPQPDLYSSSKAMQPSQVHPGVSTTYVTTLFNHAPDTAQTVTLMETLPDTVTYISGSLTAGGGYLTATRTITWAGSVAPGEEKRVTFDVLLDPTLPIHTAEQQGLVESTAFARWVGITEGKSVRLSTHLTTTALMRASARADGTQPGSDAAAPALSADSWSVAFVSGADDLVDDDTNYADDIFIHDRQTRQVTRVSLASDGTQADADADRPALSSDGHYVVFQSEATNLVANDTNATTDIFVHDRQTGTTTRVSVASDGTQADGSSYQPAISGDGRYVAFTSEATNLVEDDTNDAPDVFVHDLQEGETRRLSLSSSGVQAEGRSSRPAISTDGRYVAFQSYAANLVPDDDNGVADIFVHDRQTNRTTRASVSSSRSEANGGSYRPALSADGQYVAFESTATNLVKGDSNGYQDIFVHNRATGQTTRASVASDGTQGNGYAEQPDISGDGRYVAFASSASGLVSDDTNYARDVFVHDRDTSQTVRLSVNAEGQEGDGDADAPAISDDARYVAFVSKADNLVPADTNGHADIFVRDGGGEIVALPKIAVTPATLSFIAQAASLGGDDPAPQVLYLSRSGGGTLDYTLNTDTDWLSLSTPDGTTPNRAPITTTIADLDVGAYTGHVTACAPLAGNSPQPITVTLTITTEEIPTGDTYEADGACAQARSITVNGAAQQHTFHQMGDNDWIYFSGKAGTTYVIQATHTSPEADLSLALYGACDEDPSHSGDSAFGTDARMVFEAPEDGDYYVQVFNSDPGAYGMDVSYEVSVRAPTQGGVAVIVAGHDAQKRVQANIDNIANHAYRVFLNGGISQDNLFYLSHAPQDADGDGNDDTDGVATTASFEHAITTWAAERVDAETPFYLYLTDHGGVDLFFTNGSEDEKTWADQLDGWLTTLEQETGVTNVNMFIEACRSGSFIEGVKNVSQPGRVVIASTGTQYNAYASRDGGIFSDAFLTALGSGYNLWESFQLADEAVAVTGYMQTPWLDDNGNAQQHAIDPEDGDLARQRTLGGVDFGGLPPVIDAVSVTDVTGGTGVIRAEVRDESAVDTVWAVIYPPTFQEPAPTEDGVMPELHLQTILLLDNDGDGEYTAKYPGFTESGTYRVIAYAEDNGDNQAIPLSTTASRTSSDKGHAVYLPVVLRE